MVMASKHMWILWIFVIIWKCNYSNGLEERPENGWNMLQCEYDTVSGGQICDCGHTNVALVMPVIDGNVYRLMIGNCTTLRIRSKTFWNIAQISSIVFTNIRNLILEEFALEFPLRLPLSKVKVSLVSVTISQVRPHSFSGAIDHIEFMNCKIGIIRPFAINCLLNSVFRVSFENTLIDQLESQAFKKMTLEQMEFTNTTFLSEIPSKAFYELTISDFFSINNCQFPTIASSAFMLGEVNQFIFRNNKIEKLDGEAFRMNIKQSVSFRYNFFEELNHIAFRSINVDNSYKSRRMEPMEFDFSSNLIQSIEPIRIVTSPDFRLNLRQLKFTTPMGCSQARQLESNSFLKQFSDTAYFKIGSETGDTELQYRSLRDILTKECVLTTTVIAGIIAGIALLLLVIIVIGIFAYRYIAERKKAVELDIVKPEGKTYRETQIVMQIENAGLLKTDM